MVIEKKQHHFVLVHGAAHGAWCWYKIVDLLQQGGHKVSTVDLVSAGIDSTDPNTVASPQEQAAPLLSLLQNVPDSEKVILVVHSMGGVSGTIAMEQFPQKIAAAVFLAALMFTDVKDSRQGELLQLFLEIFDKYSKLGIVQYVFKNGTDQPPTSAKLDNVAEYFYNLSPSQDVALASTCLKPFPLWKEYTEFFPTQTPDRYGSVPRVYIQCDEDLIVDSKSSDLMCELRPPKQLLSIS